MVRIYSEKLLEMTSAEPFAVEKIIEFNLNSIPDPPNPLPKSASAMITEAASQAGLQDKLKILSDKYVPLPNPPSAHTTITTTPTAGTPPRSHPVCFPETNVHACQIRGLLLQV